MAAAKWQPLNGSKRMVPKSAKTDSQKRSETDIPKRSGVAPANQTKERSVHEFSRGHSGTKIQCESCLFSQRKTPEFTKMGEIQELFVLALSLVWFAGATPEKSENEQKRAKTVENERKRSGCFSLTVFWPFSSGHIAVAI